MKKWESPMRDRFSRYDDMTDAEMWKSVKYSLRVDNKPLRPLMKKSYIEQLNNPSKWDTFKWAARLERIGRSLRKHSKPMSAFFN